MNLYNGDSLVNTYQFRVNSHLYKDSVVYDFNDQYRLAVDDNISSLTFQVKDVNSDVLSPIKKVNLNLNSYQKHEFFSDIELSTYIDTTIKESVYSKHGVLIYPDVNEYFKSEIDTFFTYFELYNLQEDDNYFLERNVIDVNNNLTKLESFKSYQIGLWKS